MLSAITFVPATAKAALVTCQGPTDCDLKELLGVAQKIYDLIVNDIAAPLAILAVTIGAILMMIGGSDPNILSAGKKVFWSAIIGLVLVYGSRAIINLVLSAMGGGQI